MVSFGSAGHWLALANAMATGAAQARSE